MLQFLNQLPRQINPWLIFPLIFLNGWLLLVLAEELQPLISILIAATIISFLLDYPIRFLQQRGVKRSIAVGVVLLLFLFVLVGLALFLIPLILRQANELLTRLPEWIKSGQQQFQTLESWAVAQQLPLDLSSTFNQLVARFTTGLRAVTSEVFGIVFGAIGSVLNVFLTLVFSVFLVLRGESLWNGILSWFPPQWSAQIRQSLPLNFERYIAGQVTLSTLVGIFQTTMLTILGVPLAQLFGFGIGVASLIPFGGTTTIIIVSSLLALQNFWLGAKVLLFAIIVSQVIENGLGPRIVGDLTGLNPVWMLISLDIGVRIGGGLGLVVAVPIAGFIKGSFDMLRGSQQHDAEVLVQSEKPALVENGEQPISPTGREDY